MAPTYPETLNTQEEDEMLAADDAGEMIEEDQNDDDVPMSDEEEGDAGDDDEEEQVLQNDSIAHFDGHHDSIFAVAQHPVQHNVVATGGGDDCAYVFDFSSAASQPAPPPGVERTGIAQLARLDGHTDSVTALLFTRPSGEYLVTAGLDGQLRAYHDCTLTGQSYKFLAQAKEVDEINFVVATPHPDYPNTFALGASDGSVWVYTVDASDKETPLQIVQVFYLHTGPATAGAWSPDGNLLCTVAEDGSFYAWDAFGAAAAAGVVGPGQQAAVGLTQDDERFRVEGGLYSVAVAPNGSFAAAGGAGGHVRVVGLPRLASGDDGSATAGTKGGQGARAKAGGGKQAGGSKGAEASAGQSGTILASLQTQGDSVESIAFAAAPLTLMAAGSVDGGFTLYDTARRFATRRSVREAHEGEAVIKVEFAQDGTEEGKWVLTTCGNDGVVRRWDTRGASVPGQASQGQSAQAQGMIGEWKGHRGGGEGGGVLGFVQGGGRYMVTAGDDGVALVFDTKPQ